MQGWQLIETGVILIASAMWLARQYLRSEVPQPRPGLRLDDPGPLVAPPDRHARLVAAGFGGVALLGAALIIAGLLRGNAPRPAPAPAPIPVRLGPAPRLVAPGDTPPRLDSASATPAVTPAAADTPPTAPP